MRYPHVAARVMMGNVLVMAHMMPSLMMRAGFRGLHGLPKREHHAKRCDQGRQLHSDTPNDCYRTQENLVQTCGHHEAHHSQTSEKRPLSINAGFHLPRICMASIGRAGARAQFWPILEERKIRVVADTPKQNETKREQISIQRPRARDAEHHRKSLRGSFSRS
jgi:hypothetical protein